MRKGKEVERDGHEACTCASGRGDEGKGTSAVVARLHCVRSVQNSGAPSPLRPGAATTPQMKKPGKSQILGNKSQKRG